MEETPLAFIAVGIVAACLVGTAVVMILIFRDYAKSAPRAAPAKSEAGEVVKRTVTDR